MVYHLGSWDIIGCTTNNMIQCFGVSKNHQITRRKNKHDDVEQDLQKPMEVSGFIQKGLPFSGYFKGKRNTSQLRFLDRRKHEENPWRSSKFGHRTRAENQ
jgi:hypothetical protein